MLLLPLKTTSAVECCWSNGIVVLTMQKYAYRISFFCIWTSCKTWNGIKRSSFIDTYVIGEFIKPLRNQSGKYSYTWVFVKCRAFNEFLSLWMLRDSMGLLDWNFVSCFCSRWPYFVQQDLHYENHSVLVLLQQNVLCPKTKICAFSFENTKLLKHVVVHVFEFTRVVLRIQSKLDSHIFFLRNSLKRVR